MIDFTKPFYCLNRTCGVWSSPSYCFERWVKHPNENPFEWFGCWQWIDPSHQLPLQNFQLTLNFDFNE